jgi:hypothetical protein
LGKDKTTKVYVIEANFRWNEETGFGFFSINYTKMDHWVTVGMVLTREEADQIIMTKSFMFGDDPTLAGTRIIEREADEKDIVRKNGEIVSVWGDWIGS